MACGRLGSSLAAAARRAGCPRRCASSSAPSSSASSSSNSRLVIYRGPAAMKPYLNVLCGAVFMATGLNVGYMVANHLSWPLFSRDPERPPKLLPLGMRYAIAIGTVLLGLGSGYFFVLVPMRSITRLTIQPAQRAVELELKGGAAALDALAVRPPPAVPAGTTMVHIRTALPSFSSLAPFSLLPANLRYSMRINGWHHPDASTLRDRVLPLETIFRFLGKASDGMSSLEAAKRKMVLAGDVAASGSSALNPRERKSILLRVGGSKIAYTLESEGGVTPSTASPDGKPHNLYKVGWARFKHSFRARRDDDDFTPAEQAGRTGPKSMPGLGIKEPWFLDRVKFDNLFPLEKR